MSSNPLPPSKNISDELTAGLITQNVDTTGQLRSHAQKLAQYIEDLVEKAPTISLSPPSTNAAPLPFLSTLPATDTPPTPPSPTDTAQLTSFLKSHAATINTIFGDTPQTADIRRKISTLPTPPSSGTIADLPSTYTVNSWQTNASIMLVAMIIAEVSIKQANIASTTTMVGAKSATSYAKTSVASAAATEQAGESQAEATYHSAVADIIAGSLAIAGGTIALGGGLKATTQEGVVSKLTDDLKAAKAAAESVGVKISDEPTAAEAAEAAGTRTTGGAAADRPPAELNPEQNAAKTKVDNLRSELASAKKSLVGWKITEGLANITAQGVSQTAKTEATKAQATSQTQAAQQQYSGSVQQAVASLYQYMMNATQELAKDSLANASQTVQALSGIQTANAQVAIQG